MNPGKPIKNQVRDESVYKSWDRLSDRVPDAIWKYVRDHSEHGIRVDVFNGIRSEVSRQLWDKTIVIREKLRGPR